jgi:hypothetical protein
VASSTSPNGAKAAAVSGSDADLAAHGSMSFSRSSAMRSTWRQASANSVVRSLPIRRSKAARMPGLVVVAHGDDEGKAVLSV